MSSTNEKMAEMALELAGREHVTGYGVAGINVRNLASTAFDRIVRERITALGLDASTTYMSHEDKKVWQRAARTVLEGLVRSGQLRRYRGMANRVTYYLAGEGRGL